MDQTIDQANTDGSSHLDGPLGVAFDPSMDRVTRELVAAALAAASELGLDARRVRCGERQTELATLLGIGLQGGFMRVLAEPRACRRVIWVGEAIMPRQEVATGMIAAVARSNALHWLKYPLRPLQDMPLPGNLARARSRAVMERMRVRNGRQLVAAAGQVDRLVVTSRDRRAALAGYGLASTAVPFGYSEAVAGPLCPPQEGARDLAIVSLARRNSALSARSRIVERWCDDEPLLHMIDNAWGAERGDLLRRARVVLNVVQTPGDFAGLRLVLALAAGAVVVSEPMADPFPFVAGVHFVEAPLDGLLRAARELVADEPRRRQIAAAGQSLLAGELSMASCLGRVLAA